MRGETHLNGNRSAELFPFWYFHTVESILKTKIL